MEQQHQQLKIQRQLPPQRAQSMQVKIEKLKSGLKAQQSVFTKPAAQNKATEAPLRISHLLAKHKKPFTDGDLIKEAMAITAETVFNDFKTKTTLELHFVVYSLALRK